ncbi:MAG: type 1 glutamine amidotransferase [Oligoflexia bacterium]|nr:type 1 glutamine amidotransferase [Oligoflexia bacterium]
MGNTVILIEDRYQTLEVWYPYYRLREAGIKSMLAGTGRKKEYLSKDGYPAIEEIKISEIDRKNLNAVIIPGGWAPELLRQDESVISLIRDMKEKNRLIASICHGAWVLASADVIKDVTVTSFVGIRDDIINAGANYVDREVVTDGNIITSRKPDDLPAFSREIIKYLSGYR